MKFHCPQCGNIMKETERKTNKCEYCNEEYNPENLMPMNIKDIFKKMVEKDCVVINGQKKVMVSKQTAKDIEEHLGYFPDCYEINPFKPSIKELNKNETT